MTNEINYAFLIVIVGEPIDVIPISQPTTEQIEELHQIYLQSVETLFERNKLKYGLDHVRLKII